MFIDSLYANTLARPLWTDNRNISQSKFYAFVKTYIQDSFDGRDPVRIRTPIFVPSNSFHIGS